MHMRWQGRSLGPHGRRRAAMLSQQSSTPPAGHTRGLPLLPRLNARCGCMHGWSRAGRVPTRRPAARPAASAGSTHQHLGVLGQRAAELLQLLHGQALVAQAHHHRAALQQALQLLHGLLLALPRQRILYLRQRGGGGGGRTTGPGVGAHAAGTHASRLCAAPAAHERACGSKSIAGRRAQTRAGRTAGRRPPPRTAAARAWAASQRARPGAAPGAPAGCRDAAGRAARPAGRPPAAPPPPWRSCCRCTCGGARIAGGGRNAGPGRRGRASQPRLYARPTPAGSRHRRCHGAQLLPQAPRMVTDNGDGAWAAGSARVSVPRQQASQSARM